MDTGNTLNLEVGDIVWDTRYGSGVLSEFTEAKTLCYDVRFEKPVWTINGWRVYVSYDREGKDNTKQRVLYTGNKQTYYSPRGEQLVFIGKPADRPILTVENYTKWYYLFLVMPDGSVRELEDTVEIEFIDHIPFPNTVYEYSKKAGYYIDEQSYEMMIGRLLNEHPEYMSPGYSKMVFTEDMDNIYSIR